MTDNAGEYSIVYFFCIGQPIKRDTLGHQLAIFFSVIKKQTKERQSIL